MGKVYEVSSFKNSQQEGRKTLPLHAGKGTQEELMIKDQCITVDEADNVVGSASKYDVHKFNARQPRGILHRAFSVFLFNKDDKLLLQQRASGKITFPNVWTNTCCSHPLHGQNPPELDAPETLTTESALVSVPVWPVACFAVTASLLSDVACS